MAEEQAQEAAAQETQAPAPAAPSADLAAAKAELEKARAEADRLRSAEKKRKASEDAKAIELEAAKAVEDGKAKETISKLQAEHKRAMEELEALRAIEEQRLDTLIATLPEKLQQTVRSSKDTMPLANYTTLVQGLVEANQLTGEQNQHDTGTEENVSPPPAATPGSPVMKRDGRELTPESKQLLDQFRVPHKAGEQLQVNEGKFGLPLNKFIDMLERQAYGGEKMTAEAAARRK